MTTRAVLRWSSKTAPIRPRHPTRSVPGSPDGAPDANAAGTGPSSTRVPSGPTTNTLMLPRPSSAGVAPSGNATSTPCFPGCRGTMTVDGSSQPGTTSSGRRQQNPWKAPGALQRSNAEQRSSAGRREGDAVGVTEVVSGRGTRRARRRHGPAEGSANRPGNGQVALPGQGPLGRRVPGRTAPDDRAVVGKLPWSGEFGAMAQQSAGHGLSVDAGVELRRKSCSR